MSTITSLLDWITATLFRTTINTNFSNLNTDKVEWPASAVANNVVTFNWTTGKLIKDSGLALSGSNTGDQTSIVGITGTLAQFNTACTDANFASTDAANTFTGTQTITQIDMGNTDTSITRLWAWLIWVEWVRVRTTTDVVVSAASYTTDTGTSLNMDNLDIFVVTAQAGALLFNSPVWTLVQGRKLIIRIKDNGTARALTWNAVFRAMWTALPSTTVLSKTLYLWFIYNSTDSKFDLIASAQEA